VIDSAGDPRVYPSVRVEIGRLRAELNEYYSLSWELAPCGSK